MNNDTGVPVVLHDYLGNPRRAPAPSRDRRGEHTSPARPRDVIIAVLMLGATGGRRAHEVAPERKLSTANVRPLVAESNLCLSTRHAESGGGVPITEAPR